MKTSEQINEIAPAFALAQNIKDAVRGAENPFFHSEYADLEAVKAACVPPLNEQGIAVLQLPIVHEGFVGCETLLLHKSGQWIAAELLLPSPKADPQAYGSCVSYARRNSLAAVAGVATLDDDAEGAMQRQEPAKPAPPKPKAKPASAPPVEIPPPPTNVEELGAIVMTFGSKHKGQKISDIPLTDLEKAAVYDKLTSSTDRYVQGCIKEWVRLAQAAAAQPN